ncbi:MAG: phage tail protein [Oscillospiraceae bacterium]
MKQPQKYVNFYKRALQKSCLHNLEADAALGLVMTNCLRPAACITQMFDTQSEGMSFHRLKLAGVFENAKLEVIVAASDTPERSSTNDGAALVDELADPGLSVQAKMQRLCALPHVRAVNAQDLLLHELHGRYVWVFVGITPSEPGLRRLEGMRLQFPCESFTCYFPEVYQRSAFFDRYIAVFQSMLLDLEEKVDEVPRLLDYQSAPDEQVAELASWLGIENRTGLFSTAQLRRMIAQIDLFQGQKGTRCALEKIIELVCHLRPRIVEYFSWSALPMSAARRRLNEQLYGSNANQFCVILDLTAADGRLPIARAQLERLIGDYSVIGATHRLVLLRKCSHVDTHCYLDVNSCLSTPEAANVDSMTLGGYITVG